MPDLYRFHIMAGQKRTTVSLPKHLLIMFSLKKGYDLSDKKGLHAKIKNWCQQTFVDWNYDEHAIHYSQFIQQKMTEMILDKKLSKEYDSFCLSDEYEKIKF